MKVLSIAAALLFMVVVAIFVEAEANVYAKKQKVDCDGKGVCKIGLGKAGTVKIPALVAFKTAHE